MSCEWQEKTGLYVDGELEPAAQQAFATHLESCTGCATAVLEQQELKKAVRIAGKRFSAPPELYAQVRKQTQPQTAPLPWWRWGLVTAMLVVMAAFAGSWFTHSHQESNTVAQLMDQHVVMLAGLHSMDVISDDRHTVKPWFQGKLPFTFNPPELAKDSPFTLLGGNLVYANQTPGAELIYRVRLHKISIFIFSARDVRSKPTAENHAFTVDGWEQNGLQYYIVTDAAREDADKLRGLFEDANR
ncbi:MAG TPA: anti-sigma factor [Candidatus Angelobacter sp.]|nr:anti-sigma factor [Candidatus Angelobacter sp.]